MGMDPKGPSPCYPQKHTTKLTVESPRASVKCPRPPRGRGHVRGISLFMPYTAAFFVEGDTIFMNHSYVFFSQNSGVIIIFNLLHGFCAGCVIITVFRIFYFNRAPDFTEGIDDFDVQISDAGFRVGLYDQPPICL